MPIHVLLRLLLDRCDSLDDALELLQDAPVTGSSCVTLGWADGCEAALVAAELSPGGCRLVWPDDRGRLVHTNHFLLPPPAGRDTQPARSPGTLLRRWHLLGSCVPASRPSLRCARTSAARSRSAATSGPAEPWAARRRTLAAVVMEPGRCRMRVSDGPPCEAPLKPVRLPAERVA